MLRWQILGSGITSPSALADVFGTISLKIS
jgi:hypothetical protein